MKDIDISKMSEEEFDKLFEDSRQESIRRRAALTDKGRERIDDNPTLERWESETEPINKGEDE